ncbi:hypothetical protein HETIRDRAFT_430661 [Heterobasidion irregulare TC 32-1]|uniref:Uncharacterized protein n=1 Tax=Heterobasidion irregulare (strain TC 32-1) TaxID=747525 RepID=W4JQ26_HETIT|nr:uncharacterized protein HETIRDRAFT_430661 [Heterobasidion irregulare TC 32-1]ETW75185.1 hypothetical protein HETIRDRAFT_430661 [Heterobasidion irregulare TC 32-1]
MLIEAGTAGGDALASARRKGREDTLRLTAVVEQRRAFRATHEGGAGSATMTGPRHKTPSRLFRALIKNNRWNDNLDEDKIYTSATSTTEPYVTLDDNDNDNDERCPADHTVIKSEVDGSMLLDSSDGGSARERRSERLEGTVAPFVRTSELQAPMNDLQSYQMKQRAQVIYKRRETYMLLPILADCQASHRGQLRNEGSGMSLVNDPPKASISPAHFGSDFEPVEPQQKQEHSSPPPRSSTLLQQTAAEYSLETSKQNFTAPSIPLKRERSVFSEDLAYRHTTQKVAPGGEVEPDPVPTALSPTVPTREHAKDVLDFVFHIGLHNRHVQILSKHGLYDKKDFEFVRFASREMQDSLQSKPLADGFTTIDYMRLHDGLRRAFKE